MELRFGMMMLLLISILYFLPFLTAFMRYHQNSLPIFIVNVFFGWTLIGWISALIWATTDNVNANRNIG